MVITQGVTLLAAPAHTEPRVVRDLSPARVLSVCIGRNQLPWENEHAGYKKATEEWRCLLKGHGAGLPAVLQDSEGWMTALPAITRSVQMCCVPAWRQVPGWQWWHVAATSSGRGITGYWQLAWHQRCKRWVSLNLLDLHEKVLFNLTNMLVRSSSQKCLKCHHLR